MKIEMTRRTFVNSLALLPFAAEAALRAQAVPVEEAARKRAPSAASPFPVIDSHIHIFDKSQGTTYPRDMPDGGEPPQGHIALPNRYKLVAAPFGVVGAVIVEAGARLKDNDWYLDVARDNPIIVGVVGSLDPNDPAYPKNLDKLAENKLFLGVRQYGIVQALEKPGFMANLGRLRDHDCSLDVDAPGNGIRATEVMVKLLDENPNLRLVIDHLPGVTYRLKEYSDKAAMQKYVEYLNELGKRPTVWIKLSEVVHPVGGAEGKVSTDLNAYKEWLDQLWSIFGEDRIMFGSDWPQSESVEDNVHPNVIGVARAYVKSKSPAVMEKVFWKNSSKPYRWVQRDPSQRKA